MTVLVCIRRHFSRLRISLIVALLFTSSYSLYSQPGCLAGDRIHRNTRIVDAGNTCSHCTNNPPNVLLHLLHSHKPVLKLTSNYATGNCYYEHDGTLSLHYPGQTEYSTLEESYDLALVSGVTAKNLILSTRDTLSNIRFATTPPPGGDDYERMRITPAGHVGIWQEDPQELLHIGTRMTFHVGYEDDYLGYNVYRDAGNVDKLIVGTTTPPIPGYPLKYGMSRHGYIEIGAGSTSSALAGQTVDWYEGGSQFGAFAGLTIQNVDGKACASFGKYYPVENCRLFVKAFSNGSTVTDALVAVSSSNAELFRVRNNGRVGIGIADPKTTLHVLGDVTIGEERCTTSVSGFNAKLSVDGIILTKELIVTTSDWADYIFSTDYALMPLEDLRQFITEHKHLPGIPSEREVKEQGLSVSGMQVKLLEKVEQLTLYVLELAKRNTLLQQEVQELRRSRR